MAVTVNGDLTMEIAMGCGTATVFVLDSAGYDVITFNDVEVKGAANTCGNGNSSLVGSGAGNAGAPVIFSPVAELKK